MTTTNLNTVNKRSATQLLLLTLLILLTNACNSQNQTLKEHPYTNKLIESSSPYLQQHAHNPVNWYPWGEEALAKANRENKLIIISVGYAACHWCHVMEHESFEDTAVARVMNEHFVAIKVDREERPDVDQIYMDAANMINGRGGWPLNAIALSDGRPIYAGTYFPKEDWLKVLNHFIKLKVEKPDMLAKAAGQITEGIQKLNEVAPPTEAAAFAASDLSEMYQGVEKNMDFSRGGLDREPKFPMPVVHQFLLQYQHQSENPKALEAVLTTLDAMAAGGIYDQVGGGFARYSTDTVWKVPHFEKMLYDNGQLVSLYSSAYQLTKNPRYKEVVYQSIDWIERELSDKNGGFYSSLDADSEGEEGKYYVWSEEELDELLGEDAALFKEFYNVKQAGNWEQSNILHHTISREKLSQKHEIALNNFEALLKRSHDKLLSVRLKRVAPGLDDKVLTAWNALMLKGYVDAYRVFGEQRFLDRASQNAQFIRKEMLREDGGLYRNHKDGKSSINAFADDYAAVIEAFVSLYQATFEEEWLFLADSLMEYSLTHFYDEASGLFYYTSDEDDPLIARSRELIDKVIPGSNSVLAKDLFLLGTYLYKADYLTKSERMLQTVLADAKPNASFYANWGILLNWHINTPYEVAIVGKDFAQARQALDQHYLPNAFLIGGETEGKLELLEYKSVPGATMIYVCQNKVCQMPTEEVGVALKQIK
ncbi:MAG: thioredoxin domain-containing protein [Bacteroidota bacterium]